MTRSCRQGLLLAALLFGFGVSGHSASENRIKSQARWDLSEKIPRLIINVADALTPSQREMINSGFTTFSVFSMDDSSSDPKATYASYRHSCTVKYDTWEDRYEVNRIDPPPFHTEIVKDYKSWSHLCLEVVIDDPRLLALLEQDEEINGSLNIRQSTPEEGAKIKSWLVKQQSGFMQGLYAHMLGNFQYQHRLMVRIGIPKRPLQKLRAGANP